MAIRYTWRGSVENDELDRLHAEAFDARVYSADEWNWVERLSRHSLGWVVARDGDTLVGFVNVLWDGLVHAYLQDTMVASSVRRRGVGTEVVKSAVLEARAAGCEWLHVDFDEHLRPFYLDTCGFSPTNAGLIALSIERPTAATSCSEAPARVTAEGRRPSARPRDAEEDPVRHDR